ncbi:50S ribosomal protein L12 [Theileria orientalis]|uniref:50S ribosomal protein L12 n=1 Tax=Theileria orientalis TaxID=68886 RepID=A0A976XII4_THEOR|nr:50S ribosomal protein L12 [Theileria orientalis]
MIFNYTLVLSYANWLLFYTLFLSQIPCSNSLRIGITPSALTYINSHTNFIAYENSKRLSHKLTLRSSKVDEILESLKNLSLLETSELVRKIEETFGVTSSAMPQQPLNLVPQATPPQEAYKDDEEDDMEERQIDKKRKHSVVIKDINKDFLYQAYKALKQYYTNISALEVKKIMDSIPYTVKTVPTRREAEEIVKKLTAEGMTIEIE